MGLLINSTKITRDVVVIGSSIGEIRAVVRVVLTGGGHDGMEGLLTVTAAGGLSLVQKPAEAERVSLPEYAIPHDHVCAALKVEEIGDVLTILSRGEEVSTDANHRGGRREERSAAHAPVRSSAAAGASSATST
jgi:chemotaxis response regulator CheB